MNTILKPGMKSVHPSLDPVSCNNFRGARFASRCTTAQRALGTGSADSKRPPPLLLPAPGVATFCTPAVTSSLGHSPHLAARLARLSASRAGLSAPAQEAAAAGYREQMEALRQFAGPGFKTCSRCEENFERYCFPADSGSPDGRCYICYSCKADVSSQNSGLPRTSVPLSAVGEKQCFACGVHRPSNWYYATENGRAGLSARCRPCLSLYTRRQRDLRSLAPEGTLVEKQCRECEETLPIGRFTTSSSHKDGYQSKCKDCLSSASAVRYAKRVQRQKENSLEGAGGGKERVCSQCGVCKPSYEFLKRVVSNTGLESKCKQCRSNNAKSLYAAFKANKTSLTS